MVIFSDGQLPVKECEVSMLDIRHVVAIVLFLINGLWKIIRSTDVDFSIKKEYNCIVMITTLY